MDRLPVAMKERPAERRNLLAAQAFPAPQAPPPRSTLAALTISDGGWGVVLRTPFDRFLDSGAPAPWVRLCGSPNRWRARAQRGSRSGLALTLPAAFSRHRRGCRARAALPSSGPACCVAMTLSASSFAWLLSGPPSFRSGPRRNRAHSSREAPAPGRVDQLVASGSRAIGGHPRLRAWAPPKPRERRHHGEDRPPLPRPELARSPRTRANNTRAQGRRCSSG